MRERLIENFLKIASIPRGSGYEEKIANFFVEIAKRNNLYYFKDKNNNVLIKKKGTKPTDPIALQAHLDMVCVKTEDSQHNFEKDGLEVIIKEDIVTAKDTSLGADQGVGLMLMLTILEDNIIPHPDLEFLFTVEEETTFKGAINFPYEKIDSKKIINLDNAKDNSIFIGADGDICNHYTFESSKIISSLPSYKITIDNFPGGNSGVEVLNSKKNAIAVMAKLLKDKNIYLASIKGGTNENDIATFCEIIINTKENVETIFKNKNVTIKKYNNILCFNKEDTNRILKEIIDLESGYLNNKQDSANLGRIETEENKVTISYILRSIDKNRLQLLNQKTLNLKNNFTITKIYSDSAWEISKNSELIEKYKNVYYKKYKEFPVEEISHGGMECSIFKNKIKDVDIISIGSTIEKFHTIEETTYISSWIKIYECLIELLKEL